ncbi:hypothetical protein TCAL_01842 [Tigriopus californicus]|uniref:Short coiled-coil protein A n=1 Tax=Tigriopus californicus TaxID=6832 RepID=A0A553NB08_TIGCA|nr:short coiled-coil protein A-like [Tigriopus californicus]TRY62623.1 hypothetical protein TCAL_01842 [Tigriopus californicus]|eukprot:TCALIF_01842-PA protein Name:"Similar to scoca Short coiled-coil protein A (Danio rerio)" AED:0.02 eAED:0.02 QI:0/-1/0/1/-1/1/1/0/140
MSGETTPIEDDNRIPMADELDEDEDEEVLTEATAESMPTLAHSHGPDSLTSINILEGDDLSHEEQEEKARLIAQVLELQNTLDDLSSRVDNVKEENLRLRSENQVLGQYIENLMAASSVFQPANGDPGAAAHPMRSGKKK